MNLSTKIQAYESFFESNLPKEMVDSNLLSLTAQLKNSFFRQLNYYVLWKDKALSFGGCNQLFSRRFEFNKPCQVIGKTDHDFPLKRTLKTSNQNFTVITGLKLLKRRLKKSFFECTCILFTVRSW